MDALDIRTNANQETLTDTTTVFDKLEQSFLRNPQEYQAFVKKLMTQSILSNFSEQKTLIEQKQMSDLFAIANAVLYKNDYLHGHSYGYSAEYNTYGGYGYPGGADNPANATINRLWSETVSYVREIVKKSRTSFIVGAAAERAIKSVVGFYALKWITNGINKVKDLKQVKVENTNEIEDTKNLLHSKNSEIEAVNKDIDSLKTQINDLNIPPGEQRVEIDYEKILEPAARAS